MAIEELITMREHYFCDTTGNPFTGQKGENLGNFCAVAHECPHCGQLASRGRTLAWLALECHTKGHALFPCQNCGKELVFPAALFVQDCLARVATHFQPNALLRAMTADEVLTADWGERLFELNQKSAAAALPQAHDSGPVDKLGEPGEPIAEETRSESVRESVSDELGTPGSILGDPDGTAVPDLVVSTPPTADLDLNEISAIADDPFAQPLAAGRGEPLQDTIDLSSEPEPEIDFLEGGNSSEEENTAAEAQSGTATTALETTTAAEQEPPPANQREGATSPVRTWAGYGKCPTCGFSGAARQSQALCCVQCGVHFWTRQENLDRTVGSRITCPRCRFEMIVPPSVWCASCGQTMLPMETAQSLIRNSSEAGFAAASETGEGASKRKPPRGTARGLWRR